MDLSQDAKDRLHSLWKAHQREIVTVQTCSEQKAPAIASPAFNFVVRLHHFFTAVLRKALQPQQQQPPIDTRSAGRSSSGEGDSASNNEGRYITPQEQSCLLEYIQWALVQQSISSAGALPITRIRLVEGRHVLPIPHGQFLAELNTFELKGETPSTDFIRKDSFGAFLYHRSEEALTTVGCAMALAVTTMAQSMGHVNDTDIQHFVSATQIIVRFMHVQPIIPMLNIRTGLVGKFITVKGHIVKARPKRLRVATADFLCSHCGQITTHAFDRGRFAWPSGCGGSGGTTTTTANTTAASVTNKCRSRTFTLLRSTARYVNVQDLKLQEAPEESTMQAGRTPRQLELELVHDMVDRCRPGDLVLVAGIVAAINTAVAAGRAGKRIVESTSTYKLFLQGHSIVTLSETTGSNNGGHTPSPATHNFANNSSAKSHLNTSRSIIYTPAQLQSITQLCHADHRCFSLVERRAFPFDLLVRSICPSIIGHHEVKAGILLCLLGGTPTGATYTGSSATSASSTSTATSGQGIDRSISIRSNSHILIVGDPGMGKSQMLLAASQLAARSVYVGGNTSSTTGLTVTLTKDDQGDSGGGIEAGALVLADQGVCCIDEFDKMAKAHQDGLLEAMEQQQVSIAKAGVVASLPARCSIIAAANPRHGSYSQSKSIGENLSMAKPILSRFDLVYILRDRANKDLDQRVSSTIMGLYRGSDTKDVSNCSQTIPLDRPLHSSTTPEEISNRLRLSERLAWVTDFQKQPLPASLVRDYIAYAREYCRPKLTPEAAMILKEYYMQLRYPPDGLRKHDTVPITTRQLEALIRLSQARAKACLRDYVLKEDALDVVELMSQSVDQVHSDDHGQIDVTRGGAGGTSNRKMKRAFIIELSRLFGSGGMCSLVDLRRIAGNVGCGLNEFQSVIEEMRGDGFLLKKETGFFQVSL